MSVASAPASAALPPLPSGRLWHCGGCGRIIGRLCGGTLTIAYHHRLTTVTGRAQVGHKCHCGHTNTWDGPTT